MPRVEHPEGLFALELPEDWQWLPGEEGGAAVPPGKPAALYVAAHPVEDPARLPSLSRMLSGYLLEIGRPVPVTDLKEWQFPGAIGWAWQYIEERPEGPHAWRLWVAGNRAAWALVSFNSPLENEVEHRGAVDDVVSSLTLQAEEPPA